MHVEIDPYPPKKKLLKNNFSLTGNWTRGLPGLEISDIRRDLKAAYVNHYTMKDGYCKFNV